MKTKPVIIQGRDVKNCPKTDCIHHPVNGGNGECGCIDGEWGMYEQIEFDHIVYTIQPTDSVAGIAERFGADLRRLVELNPQGCTTGPQEGIEIKIPVGDGPIKRLFFRLLELYRDEAPNVFAMLYQIAEVSHNAEVGLEATIENAAEFLKAGDIGNAFDCLGITKNLYTIYSESIQDVTRPGNMQDEERNLFLITKPQKRLAELKEIRRTYRAVVEQSDPKKDPITEIAEHREKCIYRTLRDGKINIDEINKYN